jgi:hypothetical protein
MPAERLPFVAQRSTRKCAGRTEPTISEPSQAYPPGRENIDASLHLYCQG